MSNGKKHKGNAANLVFVLFPWPSDLSSWQPAPLRSVPVMQWSAPISFRSLQRSIVLLCNFLPFYIILMSQRHYKHFYLTVVHKKKKIIFIGMSLSEVIISFPICPHRCKPWLCIQNGVSDIFKQVLFKCLTFTSSGIILQTRHSRFHPGASSLYF